MSSISVVYSAKSADLPRPLPTKEEIEDSRDILSDQAARKVVGVGQHFIIKYGRGLDISEGENMLFVQQTTTVRVPRVYALYEDHADNKKYLIMERIAGNSLASEWDTLQHDQKEAISKKLRAYWDQLRNLRSPGFYCSLNKRPLLDSIFWSDDSDSPPLNGPFENEDQLNAALIKKYTYNNLPVHKAELYQRALPSVLRDHPPTFTHGDFQRKNILLQRLSTTRGRRNEEVEGDFELTVLDWEFAGWYPSYWEYSRAVFACGRWDDDWSRWVEKVLDPYFNEWAWMEMLMRELWS
ncbi:hypothetical protein FQN50_003083 [Emmonsiellopsis sp. PD_5]|nr:hypothetical protein FQN50_003083 [Emmonsiellopsis sp. PD_5]